MRSLLFVGIVSALTLTHAPSNAWAASPGKGTLYIECSPQGLITLRSKEAPREAGSTVESVNPEDLLINNGGTRAGSKSIEKKCGAFEASISGGVYNLDAFDSMGADRVFSIVRVNYKGVTLVDQKRIGACDPNDDNVLSLCPGAWAEELYFVPKSGEISIFINGKDTGSKKVP